MPSSSIASHTTAEHTSSINVSRTIVSPSHPDMIELLVVMSSLKTLLPYIDSRNEEYVSPSSPIQSLSRVEADVEIDMFDLVLCNSINIFWCFAIACIMRRKEGGLQCILLFDRFSFRP